MVIDGAWALLRHLIHLPVCVCCTHLTLLALMICHSLLVSDFRCRVNTCHWTQWRSGLFVSTVETEIQTLYVHVMLTIYFGFWLYSVIYSSPFSPPVGFILCHAVLNSDAAALSLWKLALQSSTCLCLFRDEVFHIHKAAEDLFVNIRG